MHYSLICTEKGKQHYALESTTPAAPEFLLLEVNYATICGSDYMVLQGTHPYKKYPAILGHELVGKVVQAGDGSRFICGEQVTALSYGSCGQCDYCKQQLTNHCLEKITYNTAGSSGAFSRHMHVHESSLVAIPEDSKPHDFVLAEPLSIVVHALHKVRVEASDNVLIIGAGAMGLLSAIVCREVHNVSNVTLLETHSSRQAFAESLGFLSALQFEDIPKDSVDMIIVAGGSALDFDLALSRLNIGGTLLLISYFDTLSQLDMNTVVRKEIKIAGSFLSTLDDLSVSVEMIKRSQHNESLLSKVIVERISFGQLKDFMLRTGTVGKTIVESPGVLS
ncbi:zinc-dependent alcohol dehydrogenase [Pseudomonas syringae]|uniref:zinc-dependent alcohol dehydrogenase n=1 Tax=Pseudomonas syringae TaxID=317 RepID=UPI00040149E9|nr:alcohol dehydrogenase catalytic domain-containing protein [Pseudomonas syringae]